MKELAAVCIALGAFMAGTADAQPRSRVIGYFAEWRGTSAADLPGEMLTHICYAFALVKDGECAIDNPKAFETHMAGLKQLKARHPHLKILISVGGWSGSAPFSDMALTEESRAKFARSCAQFVQKHGFDGVDIDWEYPVDGGKDPAKGRPEDKRNFTLLLQELRRQLGDKYLLAIATPAPQSIYQHMELDQIHPSLDWIGVMCYDMTGTWSKVTGLNAPLYGQGASTDSSVRGYLAAGVPAEKIVLGVPFYGHAFGGVKNIDNGLRQPHDGKAPTAAGLGGWSWQNISQNYLDKSARRFWDETAKVPWLYDEKSGLMISYDDPESIRLKAEYARQNKLGGVMIWELSQDDESHSLLKALGAGLRDP